MENLVILRMFFCFPLAGLLVPDAIIVLSEKPNRIPVKHLIIELLLIALISLCSAVIYYKRRNRKSPEDQTLFS